MQIDFYSRPHHRFDEAISSAFARGCKKHGDECYIYRLGHEMPKYRGDLAVMVGVTGYKACQGLIGDYRKPGQGEPGHWLYIDKGYTRIAGGPLGTLYFRTIIDGFHPRFRQHTYSADHSRVGVFGKICDQRPVAGAGNVIFAGSSQKYCDLHNLGDATVYAQRIITEIKRYTERTIVYRPKPSWRGAVPVKGTTYSGRDVNLQTELLNAHCLVTHGSNACLEAILFGVPAITLGGNALQALGCPSLDLIEMIKLPEIRERLDLAVSLSWCQWTLEEMSSGVAWQHLRSQLART